MRWLVIGMACLTLTGCGSREAGAPDGRTDLIGNTASSAAGVAFSYGYDFRLPSERIAAAQEEQASACEQLGAQRCRITGMSYRVDESGTVSADLDVKLDALLARRFGRAQTQAVERAGGALIGAQISGTDAQPATEQAQAASEAAVADSSQVRKELARTDLRASERATLREQQSAAEQQRREAVRALAEARASVATTPMSFSYHAGSGVGIAAKLADAGRLALSSLGLTIAAALTVLAGAGPPAVLLLIVWLVWLRLGRPVWRRLRGATD